MAGEFGPGPSLWIWRSHQHLADHHLQSWFHQLWLWHLLLYHSRPILKVLHRTSASYGYEYKNLGPSWKHKSWFMMLLESAGWFHWTRSIGWHLDASTQFESPRRLRACRSIALGDCHIPTRCSTPSWIWGWPTFLNAYHYRSSWFMSFVSDSQSHGIDMLDRSSLVIPSWWTPPSWRNPSARSCTDPPPSHRQSIVHNSYHLGLSPTSQWSSRCWIS